MKFGGLYVEFSRKEDSSNPGPGVAVLVPHVPAAEIAANQAESEKKALAQVDLEAREDEIAMLKIMDPEEYEKLVINGDLEEESTDGGEENS